MKPGDELSNGLPVKVDPPHLGSASQEPEDPGFGGYIKFIDNDPRKASLPLRLWGMPYRSNLVTEQAAAQAPIGSPISLAKGSRPRSPKWLAGTYRPKALTEAGALALALLAPGAEGLNPFPSSQLVSLEERRKYLAMRYVALDLLKLGLVFEINGHYQHIDDLEERDFLGFWTKLKLPRSASGMPEMDMLAMLAVGRLMTLDQIILADPENAGNNVDLLWALETEGLVERHQVGHGKGTWEAYALTTRTWRWLHHQYPDLSMKGIKPRLPRGKNRDFHESIQVDALAWFQQEIVDAGGVVLDIMLDRGLRQKAYQNGGGRYLDFRLHYRNANGLEGIEEIEVIGSGSTYRSRSKRDAIKHCPVLYSFSSGSSRIALGSHVCIGR